MSVQQTRKILDSHFTSKSITLVDEDNGVFRCQKAFSGHPYQIIYFDCSDSWASYDFNTGALEAYLEKYLLRDYYQNAGPLQWNYYYTFISNNKLIKQYENQKKSIESDELYSRKFVLSPAELAGWLARIDSLSRPPSGTLDKDLASVWTNELSKANLDFVVEGVPIEEGVRRITTGIIKKSGQSRVTGNQPPADNETIELIRKLYVNKFRGKTYSAPFEFGKVNLITGVNGVGKTSMLEAIELLLCGKVYRNPSADTKNTDIQAELEGFSHRLHFKDNTLKLYKERERQWYNNPSQKFSYLEIDFNKYNFYNTDAAYVLANAKKDEKKAMDAFMSIALGQEVNELESRMVKYVDRLLKDGRGYSAQALETGKRLTVENKLIAQLQKSNQNPQEFFEGIQKDLKRAKWKFKASDLSASLRKSLTKAISLVDSIIDTVAWAKLNTRKALAQQVKIYEKAVTDLKAITNTTKTITEKMATTNEWLASCKELSDLLKQIEPYYKYEADSKLPHLKKQITEYTSKVAFLTSLKKICEKINHDDFGELEPNKNIDQLDESLSKNKQAEDRAIKLLTSQRDGILSGLTQLQMIIKQIKASGIEYIRAAPDSTECPLCQSSMPAAELVKQIQHSKKTIRSSTRIGELNEEITARNKKLVGINQQLALIEQLKNIFYQLSKSRSYTRRPNFIWNTAMKQLKELPKSQERLDELNDSKDYFEIMGLEEAEFAELNASLSEFKIAIKNHEHLKIFEVKTKERIGELTNQLRELQTEENKVKVASTELLSKLGLSSKQSELVSNRFDLLLTAERLCAMLSQTKQFADSASFTDILAEIKIFHKLLDEYDALVLQKQENDARLAKSAKAIEGLTKLEADAAKKEKLVLEAAGRIQHILHTHDKEKYLEVFIDRNKNEILEIFKMVHSPKEFTDISFQSDGDIVLVRGDKGVATLNEISTGQRSALCLAVFSTLNRKLKNGPNLLMFDDPVANIDDLNVLSYLDYLREVAIKGNRQIFFATANEKLAFLFAKKFDFLGTEFHTLDLT